MTRVSDHRAAKVDQLEAAATSRIELRLLGGFQLSVADTTVELSVSAQRVVAYVALAAPGRVARVQAAGELWPDVSDNRAAGNLRSALWRVNKACPAVLHCDACSVNLGDDVWLDIVHPGRGLIDAEGQRRPPRSVPLLLPGWYDEWLVHERERVRQDFLHAVEAASRALIDTGDFHTAIDLALQAVASEPLRETPRRLAIEAHLAEGNQSEALREYRRYAELLDAELGVAPSIDLQSTIEGVTVARLLGRELTASYQRRWGGTGVTEP